MTFQTKSRSQQWMLWFCGALTAFLAHVFVSRLLLGGVSFDLFDPRSYRIAMSVATLFSLFAWETRWDGVRRECVEEERGGQRTDDLDSRARDGARALPTVQPQGDATVLSCENKETVRHCQPQPPTSTSTSAAAEATIGERLYIQARKIPHSEIPDYVADGLYLDLMGDAAAAGSAPAMAKLGEYARRRAAWVEAYYWTWCAKRGGMENLDPVLREIRQLWRMAGSPSEENNVYELFSEESGSIGRALLNLDSGCDVCSAREFLKACYPEL